jgi:hypothetical protein
MRLTNVEAVVHQPINANPGGAGQHGKFMDSARATVLANLLDQGPDG